MNIEQLILKYAVMMPVRFHFKQKYMFIQEIAKEYQSLGFEVNAVTNPKGKKALNLLVGDLKNANTIVVAHYDTPQKSVGKPLKYYPLHGTSSFVKGVGSVYTPLFLGGALALYLIIYQMPLVSFEADLVASTLRVGALIATLIMTFIMTVGISNKYNFNRNTSGVIASLLLAKKIGNDKKVAFVLTDMGCMSRTGDQMLQQALPNTLKNKTVIILDCLGSGARVGIGYRKNAKNRAEQLIKQFEDEKLYQCELDDLAIKYSSAQYYERSIVVSYGKKQGEDFIVENTASNKDIEIDEKVLSSIVEKVTNFLLQST